MVQKHFVQVVWTLVHRACGFEKFIIDMSLKEQCPSYPVPRFRAHSVEDIIQTIHYHCVIYLSIYLSYFLIIIIYIFLFSILF